MPFSSKQNKNYTPPPTGSLPTFFSGSVFNPVLAAGFTPSAPPAARNNPVPSQYVGDKKQFSENRDTGRTISASQAFGMLLSF